MSAHCHDHACREEAPADPTYRSALWIALVVNFAMFVVEIAGGVKAGSVSLLADSIDFASDAANYGLSLAVLSMGLAWRTRAALVKGLAMAGFGLFVLGRTAWAAMSVVMPEPFTMGWIAAFALAANVGVAFLLYRHRQGDANRRSVWLCSRNDAIGNVAVAMAAVVVGATGSAWPDQLVALGMAALALHSGVAVVRQARAEIAHRHALASPSC